MGLIVQKFGGSSVANAERVMNVANIVTDTYRAGNDVVVVVSAQGDTTDDLIEKAKEINPSASKRELDMLLTAGEQISIALLAMAIEKLGYPVVSLLGWQAGFNTSSAYGIARIKSIKTDRMRAEIDRHNIVVVAGFQGINKYDDLTTLGRGGSDTSAVAIAAAMHADRCQIFTDVEGVFTADPRKVPNAKKLQEITYDEMLELATLGAQVLNNRSVEMAKKYNVEIEVLSSLKRVPGTIVKEVAKMEIRTSPVFPSRVSPTTRALPLNCSQSSRRRKSTSISFSNLSAEMTRKTSPLPFPRKMQTKRSKRCTTPLTLTTKTSSATPRLRKSPLSAPAWNLTPARLPKCLKRFMSTTSTLI